MIPIAPSQRSTDSTRRMLLPPGFVGHLGAAPRVSRDYGRSCLACPCRRIRPDARPCSVESLDCDRVRSDVGSDLGLMRSQRSPQYARAMWLRRPSLADAVLAALCGLTVAVVPAADDDVGTAGCAGGGGAHPGDAAATAHGRGVAGGGVLDGRGHRPDRSRTPPIWCRSLSGCIRWAGTPHCGGAASLRSVFAIASLQVMESGSDRVRRHPDWMHLRVRSRGPAPCAEGSTRESVGDGTAGRPMPRCSQPGSWQTSGLAWADSRWGCSAPRSRECGRMPRPRRAELDVRLIESVCERGRLAVTELRWLLGILRSESVSRAPDETPRSPRRASSTSSSRSPCS